LWDGGEVRSTAETGISGGGKDLSSRLMRTLRRPWKLGNLTWGALGQERIHSGMCQTPRAVSVSEVRARLHDAARFRARSTSHTVAARDGCTNIPLAAGRGSGDETILSIGMSGHGYHRFVHPDPPELIRSWEI